MVMVMDGNCSLDGEQVVGCTEVERECWTHETYTVLETNVTSIKNNLKKMPGKNKTTFLQVPRKETISPLSLKPTRKEDRKHVV